jgi:hypothetical protein
MMDMTNARQARRLAAGIAAAAALAGTPLAAQQSGPPAAGETVRLHSPSPGPGTIRGRVMEVRGDTLFVLPDDGRATLAVPATEIAWIDVRRPNSFGFGLVRGVLIGAPLGAGSGVLAGILAEAGKKNCPDCGLTAIYTGVAGLVSGTVIGAVVGAGSPGRHWEHTAPPIVEAAPGPGGVAVSMRIRL